MEEKTTLTASLNFVSSLKSLIHKSIFGYAKEVDNT